MLDRVIGHLDLDYFYAQVEEVQDPSIKSRPVVVCVFSGRTEDSGVVSTANYIARDLGVRSGLPIVVAKRKLEGKDPVVIKLDHGKYEVVSDRVMEIIGDQVDVLDQTGIDEAFFDVTLKIKGDYPAARRLASEIKHEILKKERLTCSIGVGRSKAVAKIASDFSKPDGLTVVVPSSTQEFLGPLPVAELYGVGPKTNAILEEMGVKTIGDLAKTDLSILGDRLGRKLAAYFHSSAVGLDDDPVREARQRVQLSRIVTLKQDTRDPHLVVSRLQDAVKDLHDKLVNSGKSFRTLSAIGIMSDLSMKTRSKSFESPVNDIDTIREATLLLFVELTESAPKDLRRVGLRISDLVDSEDQSTLSEFVRSPR